MGRKKKSFIFYLDRWLRSMKTGIKATLRSLTWKYAILLMFSNNFHHYQSMDMEDLQQQMRNWGNRHANIHRHPLFKIYDSPLMLTTIGDENPYLIINQKHRNWKEKPWGYPFLHTSHISLNIRICWTCNRIVHNSYVALYHCADVWMFCEWRWKWRNVMVININHMLSSKAIHVDCQWNA